MNAPFPVVRNNGMVFVDRRTDEAFRHALNSGVPPQLRGKMREALAAIPHKGAMAHSQRYFGDELADIKNRIAPLIIWLNQYLSEHNIRGLYDWLDATNYGNDYRMIKVFAAWADMIKTPGIIKPNG